MAQALQRKLTSIDVSDPQLYQDDAWRPLFLSGNHSADLFPSVGSLHHAGS